MTATTDPGRPPALADALGAAILGDLTATEPDGRGLDALAVVGRCAEADREVRRLLHTAVAAARGAGHSWTQIGRELGMTRQAAQQRFGVERPTEDEGPDERWLGPVTVLDELAELDLAGRMGWHTVGAGLLRHRVRRTSTQWQHKRVLWGGHTRALQEQGWRIGCRAFPWLYLVRDTGLPVTAPAP